MYLPLRWNKSVISRHIKSIFKEEELDENRTIAKNATVQKEGENRVCAKNARTGHDCKKYVVDYYNLDVIISANYRVKSMEVGGGCALIPNVDKFEMVEE